MKITCQSRPIQIAGLAFALTTLLLFQARSIAAQSPEPQKPTSEVQQLRERLQQLEQTVQELRTQINAIEESKK